MLFQETQVDTATLRKNCPYLELFSSAFSVFSSDVGKRGPE